MPEPSAASPTLIQSLQRGMHLVAAVSEYGPLTARALGEKTGIALPTTYHLLRTLVHEGYLRRSGEGRYTLGAQLTSVTQMESRARSVRLVRDEMSALAQEARVSVSIGVTCGNDMVISQFVAHPCTPRFECWPGMPIPGHATAVGKSVLAQMDSGQRAGYLATHPLDALTSHTITATWRLDRDLTGSTAIRSDQEFCYGISCTAVPLDTKNAVAALGATYASSRAHRLHGHIEDLLRDASARIAEAIRLVGPYGVDASFDDTEPDKAAI